MNESKFYVDPGVNLSVQGMATRIEDANAALIELSGDMKKDLARVRAITESPDTWHLALFCFSMNYVESADYLALLDAGVIDVFEYPELDELMICHLRGMGLVPKGERFPGYARSVNYSVCVYDDNSQIMMWVNSILRKTNITPKGDPDHKNFHETALRSDADAYLIDLIHRDEEIGTQIIEDLRPKVSGVILAHSRLPDPTIKVECFKAGAQGYIEKTGDAEIFLARIKKYVAIGRYLKNRGSNVSR